MSHADAQRLTSFATVLDRQTRMLRTAMGPTIAAALDDPEIVEVMLNPDGALWFDRQGAGRAPTGEVLTAADAERIIRLVAAHMRIEVHAGAPIVSAELPETGERFEGILPPVARAPIFAIRKRAGGIIPLYRYIAEGILTEAEAVTLRQAVVDRQNILIAGGTSTGKTTLANALLREIAATGDRVILLEDTVELQCASADHASMRTKPGVTTMAQLVRCTLRLRPDRIVVGEVRGPEALDLLKAWGTGHPGGIATIHAGSAQGALTRLEQLIQEVVITVPRVLIAESVNLIVFIAGRGRLRRVQEIVRVTGLDVHGYCLELIAHDKFQGQEAPVVIYSTATSSWKDAPHGMEFLFNRHRLNVATSRARCVCILVGNPELFEPECRTPGQMRMANAFCRYLELAKVWSPA